MELKTVRSSYSMISLQVFIDKRVSFFSDISREIVRNWGIDNLNPVLRLQELIHL